MEDILQKIAEISEAITAIAGFIAGWFGKKQKDKPKTRRNG